MCSSIYLNSEEEGIGGAVRIRYGLVTMAMYHGLPLYTVLIIGKSEREKHHIFELVGGSSEGGESVVSNK